MVKTAKDRRRSGWYSPHPNIKLKELKENDLVIDEQYDPWKDYKDGMNDRLTDKKKIKELKSPWWIKKHPERVIANKKQKRLLKIRKAKKEIRK